MITLEQREITTLGGSIVRNIKMAGESRGITGLIMNAHNEVEEVRYITGRGWFTESYLNAEKASTPSIPNNQ